jgi:putative serine protease PepD
MDHHPDPLYVRSSASEGQRSGRPGPEDGAGLRRFAVATLASAVLGASLLAAILLASGAIETGASASAAPAPETTGPTTPNAALHPAALYAAAAPGVVDITAQGSTTVPGPFGSTREQSTSTGSGIVVDRKGHVLTADHVVAGSSSVTVTFANGRTRKARVVGHDATTDLAVLAVDASALSLHPLALGDSAALQVGDPVAAIGDPFGYRRSMSAGIVSGLDRTIQGLNGFSVAHAVQTDAAIDPGNSGGPLVDSRGRVIGIVDQIATGNSGADSSTGVGFAISSNVARAELGALERGAAPAHAYLGVETAPSAGPGGGTAVAVVAVQGGGPAARAGLHAGDIVEELDGRPLRGVNDLIASVASHRPGQAVTLGVRRGARHLRLRVVLGLQPTTSSAG